MRNRITEKDVAGAAESLKTIRQERGEKTWLAVEYYNGYCHLHEVDADTEARHCCIRHIDGGTKREMFNHLRHAAY